MVRELRPGVWWIDLVGVNAYLVEDGETLTLVDAGSPWDARTIRKAITAVTGSVADIDRILLTHYDLDHVGTLHRLDGLDATIHIGRADLAVLRGERKPTWQTQKEVFQRAVDWLRKPPSLPVKAVDDGDKIGSFTAYSAPGHTPGHTVFVSEEQSVAFLGDLVRESKGRYVAPPRIICQDYEQARRDIPAIAEDVPDFEAGCQGHGIPFKARGGEQLRACAAAIGTQPRTVGSSDVERST